MHHHPIGMRIILNLTSTIQRDETSPLQLAKPHISIVVWEISAIEL